MTLGLFFAYLVFVTSNVQLARLATEASKTKISKKNYWFRHKYIGWGWGLPANQKGWRAFAYYFAFIISAAIVFLPEEGSVPAFELSLFIISLIIGSTMLVYIANKTGPKPDWRWRGKPTRKSKK